MNVKLFLLLFSLSGSSIGGVVTTFSEATKRESNKRYFLPLPSLIYWTIDHATNKLPKTYSLDRPSVLSWSLGKDLTCPPLSPFLQLN